MSRTKYGVVAVGNALVDVLSQVPEEFVNKQSQEHGMEKGAMTLVEETRAVNLYSNMPDSLETSGGSAANTMAGFASLGGTGGFIGKVADDELGKAFQNDIRSLGVHYETHPLVIGPSTGRCMILVTPDAERTMNTFLGASVELSANDVDRTLISAAQVTYLEGYLFDRDQAKEAFVTAAEYAHEAGQRIALTLSDPFCVDRHREDFKHLVENHVDILFANESELTSLYQTDNYQEAIDAVKGHVEISALTRGSQGSVILSEGQQIEIAAAPVEKVIDTTGAGDQYAAGFLYGFTEGKSLEKCGQLASIAAGEVISHIGPRPQVRLSTLID